jgi:flagellar biosynthesis protein FlhF
VLNIPLFFAYTPQELGELVAEQDAADLILVDTPGVNMMDEDKVLELGTFLSQVPGRSIYLTTPATTKLADLRQSVSTFSPFSIRGFVVTKMDETFAFGEIFQLVLETHLPVMYFTNGTQVLGKLQPGEPSSLVSAIFGEGLRS